MASTAITPSIGGPARNRSYRAVWRWHFFAALWITPVLVVLTITGAIYLFDREIDGWWNRDRLTVVPTGEALPLARQEAIVRQAFPGAEPARIRLPFYRTDAGVWNVRTPDGAILDVYLDPYRGRITGTGDPAKQPMAIVRDLHGRLMGGAVGGYIVELVACWTLVMMATGIWMWWPRRWKLRGVVVPRLDTGGRRYWRDLHAIPAIFNAVLVILLVLSGLPWSAFWGEQFARIGQHLPLIAPSPNFRAAPKVDGEVEQDRHAMHRQHPASDPDRAKLPWTIRHSPVPHGTGSGGVGIGYIEHLLPKLDRAHYGEGVRIFYPQQPGDVFTVSYVPDKAEGQRTLYIDPGTGHMVGNIGWSDYSPVAKAVEWGVMTHMGRQYGPINQIANLAVCLTLLGGVGAGLILWWRRRPRGTLGAPVRHEDDRMPRGLKLLLAAMAILFPLVAVSMVPVILWSYRGRCGKDGPSPVAA